MVAAIKMLYVDVRACDDVDVDAFQYVNMVAAPHLNYDLVMQETDYPVHVAAYQLDLKYQIQNKNIIKKKPNSTRKTKYELVWKRLSAENGFGFGCTVGGAVNGLAVDTGGGIGAVNIGAAAGNVECNGGVGRGGAGLSCVEAAAAAAVAVDVPDDGPLLLLLLLLLHGLLRLLARLEDTVVVGGGQLVDTLLRLKLFTLLKTQQ